MKIPRRQLGALPRKAPLKPLPAARSSWGAIAGVFGFVISIVSFGFSIVAFMNSAKQDDDLRVVLNEDSLVFFKGDQHRKLTVRLHDTFTFTNAGNRSVAITSMAFGIQKEDATKECSLPFVELPGAGFEPFMIKAGEIAVKQLIIPAPNQKLDSYASEDVELDQDSLGSSIVVWTCLILNIVTPDDVLTHVSEPINRYVLELNGKGWSKDLDGQQKTLFKHKRFSLF